MILEYPEYLPNVRFIALILLVTVITYYFNVQSVPNKIKYFITIIGTLLIMLIPVPFFKEDPNFGALIVTPDDYRGYLPFTLLYMIGIILNFLSVQFATIRSNGKEVDYKTAMLFIFLIPHYFYNKTALTTKSTEEQKKGFYKQIYLSLIQVFVCWILMVIIFKYAPIPDDLYSYCFKSKWGPLFLLGSGVVTISMFMMISAMVTILTCLVNIIEGINLKIYSDKPFLSTSIGEFWKRWNLWTNDWFYNYIYKPLRRHYKFSHSVAILAIFFVSAILHYYCILLINPSRAWIAFAFFMLNGFAVCIEEFISRKIKILKYVPKPIKFILTFLYLLITIGIFGFCFSN